MRADVSETAVAVLVSTLNNEVASGGGEVNRRKNLQQALGGLVIRGGRTFVTLVVDLLEGAVIDALKLTNGAEKANPSTEPNADVKVAVYRKRINPLLALLTAMCHGNREAQDEVGERGLYAVLNASSLGVQYLTVREYSVLCLKETLEGHEGNQTIVQRLKAQEGKKTGVTEKCGVEVKVDQFGKVEVVGKEGGKGKVEIVKKREVV